MVSEGLAGYDFVSSASAGHNFAVADIEHAVILNEARRAFGALVPLNLVENENVALFECTE